MLFIRHGQSTFNIGFDATGRDPQIPDAPLSPQGIKQVETAAERLKKETKIETIICSPYTRALQTASLIAEKLAAPIHVEPLVGERRLYSCDIGQPIAALRARWPKADFSRLMHEGEWWLPFNESMGDVQRRAGAFRAEWESAGNEKRTLVVSHWYFIYAATGLGLDNAEIAAENL